MKCGKISKNDKIILQGQNTLKKLNIYKESPALLLVHHLWTCIIWPLEVSVTRFHSQWKTNATFQVQLHLIDIFTCWLYKSGHRSPERSHDIFDSPHHFNKLAINYCNLKVCSSGHHLVEMVESLLVVSSNNGLSCVVNVIK